MFLHQERKKLSNLAALRFRPLLGRDMRIISIPHNTRTHLYVDLGRIEMENDEEIFWVKKQPGLFDEGIIITGGGR